jgi:polysaccharide pyruvyl transferase CsaB
MLPAEIARVRAALDAALANPVDVLVNFRAASLTMDMLRLIRRKGVRSVVWLPDDPVLYEVCYKAVVGHYDLVLNCGGERILEHYRVHQGITGVNFPFWADNTSFPHLYAQETAKLDFVFLGHCVGPVRQNRYNLLASLPGRGRIFGKVDSDPQQISAGFLKGSRAVAEALASARLGINVPQFFSDYHGHHFDYPALASLGSFEFPSRALQYAAIGLPVASYGRSFPPETFPEMLVAPDGNAFRQAVASALADPEALGRRAAATHDRFLVSFSADCRARCLEFLLTDDARWRALPAGDRARLFVDFGDTQASTSMCRLRSQSAGLGASSIVEQREQLRGLRLESPRKWRVLFIGTANNGPTDVVNCLLRAFRNLGHHVTHVDQRVRRGFLKEGPKVRGGFGPNYVDPQSVLQAAAKTHSNVVFCVGGGLCFAECDADDLRAKGLLLVGITLSDPDVQESIIDAVGRFDFHFTNSRQALERYRERGIRNTSLMPFGIDRNWVLTDIGEDPAYRADVICLGHASGRPERIAAMTRLAETFSSVRTYGRGWPLPGAVPVSGLELLQASRGGSIHVNFALTRAGFTNVKCGVFESIGSGAVVCTDAFDEMGQYFDYGSEIVAFSGPEDLVERIRWLLGDSDSRESIRRCAFRRLLAEHLYEHRWLAALELMETEIFREQRVLSPDRATQLRTSAAGFSDANVRVLVTGFYGHRNLGDELILRSLTEAAAAQRPEVQFVVATNMPANVATLHELEAVQLVDGDALADAAAGVDATVLGGGGLWHDYSFAPSGGHAGLFNGSGASLGGYARPSIAALSHGAPFHVFGLGVGPLEHDGAKRFLRYLGKQADSIMVRDGASAAFLAGIEGWSGPVETSPDAVYGLNIAERRPPPAVAELASAMPVLAINLRPWPGAPATSFIDRLAEALTTFVEQVPCALVGVPMQAGQSVDERAIGELFERILSCSPKLILPWSDDVAEIAGSLGVARIVVAMRLHACLLAHRLGRPTLGLAYDPKVSAHFRELARDRYALGLGESVSAYHQALLALNAEAGALPEATSKRIAGLESAARSATAAFLQRLPRAPLPHRTSYFGHVSVDKAKGIARERAKQDPTTRGAKASVDGGPIRGNWGKPLAAIRVTGDFSLVGGFADMESPATELRAEPIWVALRLTPGTPYQLWYRIRMHGDEKKNACIVLFQVEGDDTAARNEWGFYSKANGRFRYMPHGSGGLANVAFAAPSPSGLVRIGFRSWRNIEPVSIARTLVLYEA